MENRNPKHTSFSEAEIISFFSSPHQQQQQQQQPFPPYPPLIPLTQQQYDYRIRAPSY
jgi:hypothetical protein